MPQKGYRKGCDERDLEILTQLYGEGFTTRQLGEKWDVAPTTIGVWLKKAGVKMKPQGRYFK
jgi:transcriptional regulator of aromatic amino acid metabolism